MPDDDVPGPTWEAPTLRHDLDETRACLMTALESVPGAVVLLSPTLEPVFQNGPALRAFRLSGAAQPVPLLPALTPAEMSWLAAACAAVRRSGDAWMRERRLERPNVWVAFRLVPAGSLVAVFFADVTRRRAAEAERQRLLTRAGHLARHDALTGLPNRLDFHDRLEQALLDRAAGDRCALLVLDLDHFGQINETWGRGMGDALLCQVADRLRAQVHQPDSVVRLGGDEFGVLVTRLVAPSGAGRLAERLIAQMRQPFGIAGPRVGVGASVGIALGPDDATTATALMGVADAALAAAKRVGGNTFRFAGG